MRMIRLRTIESSESTPAWKVAPPPNAAVALAVQPSVSSTPYVNAKPPSCVT